MNPSQSKEKLAAIYTRRGIERLDYLLEILRSTEGCPWDREQTHKTLLPCLLEETHEFIAAVEKGDIASMVEELGDLLLQVVFHARLLLEQGHCSLSQVAEKTVDKLVTRHPHVFGEERVESASEVIERWEVRKSQDRGEIGENLPSTLPALIKALKVSDRAARSGLEFSGMEEVFRKVIEELNEFREIWNLPEEETRKARLEEELGDLLFTVVNLGRIAGINPELALYRSVEKFVERFSRMEKPHGARHESEELSQRWDLAWEKAKTFRG